MTGPGRSAAEDALAGAYGKIGEVASGLTEASAMLPSRCAGWTVQDVLYHQLLDARRALVTFASPSGGPPDTDYVSYWRPFSPASGHPAALGSAGAARHARHVRIAASAYPPQMLAREWEETSAAAVRAARTCPHQTLATQGRALPTADFTATLAVEAAIHYLDMTLTLAAAPEPDPASLALVRHLLDQLAGSPLPAGWDDATCALKGTGRLTISQADQSALGPAAGKLPLFG
ncbi:MAG: maleylpyruvate isomerase N-terminal domain-containing protein [Actinobacteria bacterium]|nr:maleylpyruvate isomerase N-terminal domain-containing protein [Actinomycetota bacterium]